MPFASYSHHRLPQTSVPRSLELKSSVGAAHTPFRGTPSRYISSASQPAGVRSQSIQSLVSPSELFPRNTRNSTIEVDSALLRSAQTKSILLHQCVGHGDFQLTPEVKARTETFLLPSPIVNKPLFKNSGIRFRRHTAHSVSCFNASSLLLRQKPSIS